ncbi:MAG TPA: helix-turn-helix domain-containing protein, partial [Actinomycetota bacterium]
MAKAKPKSVPRIGKDRRHEILAAAARVITDRGLAETRISDIADEAGVSPGLILYYFESKDRLLAEALTFANDQFYLRTSREIRRIPSAKDRLRRLIDLSVPGYLPEFERL